MRPSATSSSRSYRALQTMWRSNRGKTGDDSFCASDIDIAQMCLAIDARTPVDERSVESGLGIFEELGFCRVSGFDDTRRIAMARKPRPRAIEQVNSLFGGFALAHGVFGFPGVGRSIRALLIC